jgi:hypothetical protein
MSEMDCGCVASIGLGILCHSFGMIERNFTPLPSSISLSLFESKSILHELFLFRMVLENIEKCRLSYLIAELKAAMRGQVRNEDKNTLEASEHKFEVIKIA